MSCFSSLFKVYVSKFIININIFNHTQVLEKHDENDSHKGKQAELEQQISKLEQENKELKESGNK